MTAAEIEPDHIVRHPTQTTSAWAIPHVTPTPPDVCRLVEENIAVVDRVAGPLLRVLPPHKHDELLSAGRLGLVQAARTFNPAMGVPFAGYAALRIRGEMLDEVRRQDWAYRSVWLRARALGDARDQLWVQLRRAPSVDEVAAAAGLTRAQVTANVADVARAVPADLEEAEERVADPEQPEETLLLRERLAMLRDAVDSLPPTARTVIDGVFFQERSLAELAGDLSDSPSRLRQIQQEALGLLRHALTVLLDDPGPVDASRAAYVAEVAAKRTYAERLRPVPEPPATTSSAVSVETGPWHGTVTRYDHGCRCPECTAAKGVARKANQRARVRDGAAGRRPIPHGTHNGYISYGCRCADCKQAARDYRAARASAREVAA